MRRLWRGLELRQRAPGPDAVRTQDPDPPGVVQLRPHLPRWQLPGVHDHRDRPRRPEGRASEAADSTIDDGDLPPDPTIPDEADVLLIGIGGTGVVTVSQVLATAALLDGKYLERSRPDRPGPEGRPGRVERTDHRLGDRGEGVQSGRVPPTPCWSSIWSLRSRTSTGPSAERTEAIVSTGLIPTGAMVSGRAQRAVPGARALQIALIESTTCTESLWLDAAGIARRQWRSQPAANVLVLGLAFQRGLLPVTAASLERAIELNGVAVETNLAAFRLGRRLAADPSLLDQLRRRSTRRPRPRRSTRWRPSSGEHQSLAEVLAWRVPELIEWEDRGYAKRYVDQVRRVRAAESAAVGGRTELSEAVARYLYKFMAYKDEYEVARLALRPTWPHRESKVG